MERMLHPALRLLWRLQLKSGWRRITRSVRTGRGILKLVLTLALLGVTFGPLAVFSFVREAPDPAAARSFLEPGILAFTLLIVIANGPNSGIFFTPPETDFLFPGPFRRRELILYRLGHQVHAALSGALFLSVAPAAFVPHWVFAFLGIALVLQFIQLLSTILGLTISVIGQTAYNRARKIALALIAALFLAAVAQAAASSSGGFGVSAIKEFTKTPLGRVVLLPFQVFSRTIAAERLFPEFLGWGAVALSINAALIALTLRLDADFYERSLAVSERVYRALQNARRGQAWMTWSKPSAGRWRLPMFARLRGAGPIAWRQSVSALRSSRGVIIVLLIMSGAMALAGYLMRENGAGIPITILGMSALFTFPQMLQFDFRGDIERIDVLKTLPISAGAIVAGELIVPVIAATIIEWALVLVTGPLATDWITVLLVCAWLPAANLIVFAVENLVFLYFPRRQDNKGTNFQASGRQMAVNFIKVFALAAAAGITGGFGTIAYFIFGGSMTAALGTAWCGSVLLGVLLVWQVSRAFRVLDPSLEN